jgi:hypothetical protein
MLILLLGAVVIPVGAVVLFAILEYASSTTLTVWEILVASSRDMCNVSIGIVGGMFGNEKLQARLGPGVAIEAIVLVGLNVILCAVALLVSKRGRNLGLDKQAFICLFIGCFSIAIPSIVIFWIGG